MIEHSILGNLIEDEKYCRAVLPYLKEDYFQHSELVLFKIINSFVEKYNSLPTKEAIGIEISSLDSLDESQFKDVIKLLDLIEPDPKTNRDFLVKQTEKFAQEKALHNALRQSISIIDDPKEGSKASIPALLTEALAVCFDPRVGHDYLEDAEFRYDEYHKPKNRLSFDLDYFNRIYDGGLLDSTMLVIMAPTGVGKSLSMCHFAASHLMQGKNVVYFTMEMSEEQIGNRIDHNLLGISRDELEKMPKDTFLRRMARIRDKTKGKLVVKGFTSGRASAAHFRHILNELRMKKNFHPDVIFVDYLNICASSSMRMGGSINTNTLFGSIAVELRGLAQEYKIPLITATQTNRDGMNSSDIDMTNTSDAINITHTTDYMIAMITSEELEQLGQIMFKQLKNRYGDPTKYRRFVVGIDRSRMRFYDVEQEAQEELIQDESSVNDRSVMDNSKFGEEDSERGKFVPRHQRGKFRGFS